MDDMPAHSQLPGFEQFVALTDFGKASLKLAFGTKSTMPPVAANVLDYGGRWMRSILEPDARRDGIFEWQGREEAFRNAVRAYAVRLGDETSSTQRQYAPAYIVFDPDRECMNHEKVRGA